MSEHYCKNCKHDGNNVCEFTGARHGTGITCPSFKQKENEMFKKNDRVKVVADKKRLKELGIPDRCKLTGVKGVVGYAGDHSISVDFYIPHYDNWNFNVGDLELAGTPVEAEPDRTFVGHPEGVLEMKDDHNGLQSLNEPQPSTRTFDSGATRDTDQGKLDYEGFLHPAVIERYAEYLNKHRIQSDGKLRDSDNWQKGMPIAEYMKSKCRHFMDTWLWHRCGSLRAGHKDIDIEDTLCAELFNTQGMLLEVMRAEGGIDRTAPTEEYQVPIDGKVTHGRSNPVEGGY